MTTREDILRFLQERFGQDSPVRFLLAAEFTGHAVIENCRYLLSLLRSAPERVNTLLFRYAIQREIKVSNSVMNARFLYELLLKMVKEGSIDVESREENIVVDRERQLMTSAWREFIKVFTLMIRYDPSAQRARRYFEDMGRFVGEGQQGVHAETCLVFSLLVCNDGDLTDAERLYRDMNARYQSRDLEVVRSVYRAFHQGAARGGENIGHQMAMLDRIDRDESSVPLHTDSVSSFDIPSTATSSPSSTRDVNTSQMGTETSQVSSSNTDNESSGPSSRMSFGTENSTVSSSSRWSSGRGRGRGQSRDRALDCVFGRGRSRGRSRGRGRGGRGRGRGGRSDDMVSMTSFASIATTSIPLLMTDHANVRSNERDIDEEAMQLCIKYGVRQSDMRPVYKTQYKDVVIVFVMTMRGREKVPRVITCYRRNTESQETPLRLRQIPEVVDRIAFEAMFSDTANAGEMFLNVQERIRRMLDELATRMEANQELRVGDNSLLREDLSMLFALLLLNAPTYEILLMLLRFIHDNNLKITNNTLRTMRGEEDDMVYYDPGDEIEEDEDLDEMEDD